MKHVIIYSFWFNTYTYVNARLIYKTWDMLFVVSMHTCHAHKWNIYGTWNMEQDLLCQCTPTLKWNMLFSCP